MKFFSLNLPSFNIVHSIYKYDRDFRLFGFFLFFLFIYQTRKKNTREENKSGLYSRIKILLEFCRMYFLSIFVFSSVFKRTTTTKKESEREREEYDKQQEIVMVVVNERTNFVFLF